MKSSTRQTIACLVLILCTPLYTHSQTSIVKKGLASISGKVTIKGKGAPGIVVGLRAADYIGPRTSQYRATTNQDGNYRITNVPAGSYQVAPAVLSFVIGGEPRGKTVIIAEGETVEGIDFSLTRGGVITGRVTDADGRPLIEEQVQLLQVVSNNQGGPIYVNTPRVAQTDDLGIYRAFGLSQGSYRVAVGQGDEASFAGGWRRSQYQQTFHPAATDPSKATVIEVSEGSEATNVDITVERALATFAVSGRIVDCKTGQPLPNVKYGLQSIAQHRSFTTSGSATNSRGEFKLEKLMPGKYAVFIAQEETREIYGDVSFDVIDQDISGLIVKASHGGSVSGLIVLEGGEKSPLPKLNQLYLHAYGQNGENASAVQRSATINPDGSFRVGGLRAGIVNFSVSLRNGGTFRNLPVVLVERDGGAQSQSVEVKDEEQVSGIRLVVNCSSGTIRGLIKLANAELPANARSFVWLTNVGEDPTKPTRMSMPPAQVDARGHFLMQGVPAGNYEVNANVFIPGMRSRPSAKQQVNVADGVETEVTLTLDLKSNSGPGNP